VRRASTCGYLQCVQELLDVGPVDEVDLTTERWSATKRVFYWSTGIEP
jgi:hypothetical protein